MDEAITHYCRHETCDKYMQPQARMWNHRAGEPNLNAGDWWNHQAAWTSDGRCKSCGQRMTAEDNLPEQERDAIRGALQRKYEERRDRLMARFRTNEPVWTTTRVIDGQRMVTKYSGRRNGVPFTEHVMEIFDGV